MGKKTCFLNIYINKLTAPTTAGPNLIIRIKTLAQETNHPGIAGCARARMLVRGPHLL